LIKKLGDEILKFQEVLSAEKKYREETQGTMFRMLEEMHNRLQNELQVFY
jgi:hypothetical protein